VYREAEPHDEGFSTERVARPAGFPIRAVARSIDLVFGLALGMVAGAVTGIGLALVEAWGALAPGWQARIDELDATGFVLGTVGSILYFAVSEWVGGATLGKWLCGLRVYTAELTLDRAFLLALHPCTARGALLRSVAWLVDAMFCGAIAYLTMKDSATQARLGDRWGRTVVVLASSTRAAPPTRPALGLLAGAAVFGICLSLTLIIRVL
jgi:uncharacterized RDD family membrane protein YckC